MNRIRGHIIYEAKKPKPVPTNGMKYNPNKPKNWTPEMDEILIRDYLVIDTSLLAYRLKRTRHAIQGRAYRLGLTRKHQVSA